MRVTKAQFTSQIGERTSGKPILAGNRIGPDINQMRRIPAPDEAAQESRYYRAIFIADGVNRGRRGFRLCGASRNQVFESSLLGGEPRIPRVDILQEASQRFFPVFGHDSEQGT